MKDAARTLAWDDFRLINAVAEARNLPAAAARLGIDHSTVFRRLRAVEALLGTPLFERHRAGYALTPAGEEVAALAARVDEDITAVTRRLAGQAPAPSGELRLATSDSLLSDLLMPMLARFRRAHPAIRLDVVTGNAALNLSRRDADVAVRATDDPPDTLVGRRVAGIAWALYGADGRTAEGDWVCLGDNLAGMRVVRAAREAVPAARLAGRFDTVLGLAQAVEAGIGVGHLPCFIGDAWPGLVRLAPPQPEYASSLWLLTHPDLRHTPRVRALLDVLAEAIAERRPLIEGLSPRAA
ncbi:LysR family transcriptional regulator [Roseomonas nepalensis]|uniref:LysR family transcriptional regulator n=1 Tax=Muricoccus nepalensis TaxID=1854500 RepID=A0A502FUT9_9PROT|nr:LysR family transcriptional regulator [Roseomonas nepalensis]TPG53387.1 LysR family transcriptional regulator [Roseomonas nepalensis]